MAGYDLTDIIKSERPLQIAICGAHGVGKTTLAKKLADELKAKYVLGVTRELVELLNFDWKEEHEEYVAKFEEAIYYWYKFVFGYLSDHNCSYVADRSLYDVAAYCLWHCVKNPPYRTYIWDVYNLVLNHIAGQGSYHNLILFYTTEGLMADSCQLFIEATIRELLWRYEEDTKPVLTIKRGDELRFGGKVIKV